MLVLEATSNRQGERPGDYHWCDDGELAYRSVVDCARPDCGCERGWVGADSRASTTTVQVVERPTLTVDQLASMLAVSLFDGGWIAAADPADELVSILVEDVIETANYFDEGSVIERDGEWCRARDGSNEEINPLNRAALEDLTEDTLLSGPMDTMSKAVSVLVGAGAFVDPLLSNLADAPWPEAQALGCAIDWLHHGKLTYEWVDIPSWLSHLDRAEVTEARRCKGDDGDGYLVAISVDGYELGIASFFVKHEGYIDSFFAIPDPISSYTQLMKTLQRSAFKPFRKIAPSTALRAMEAARDVPVENDVVLPGMAWPKNRPLLAFIADKVRW